MKMLLSLSVQHSGIKISVAQVCECRLGNLDPVRSLTSRQNSFAMVHSMRTCQIDSLSAPQTSQKAVGSICRRYSTDFAGKNSWSTLHQNTRTFGGTLSFHVSFQKTSPEHPVEPARVSDRLSSLSKCRAFPAPKPSSHHHLVISTEFEVLLLHPPG